MQVRLDVSRKSLQDRSLLGQERLRDELLAQFGKLLDPKDFAKPRLDCLDSHFRAAFRHGVTRYFHDFTKDPIHFRDGTLSIWVARAAQGFSQVRLCADPIHCILKRLKLFNNFLGQPCCVLPAELGEVPYMLHRFLSWAFSEKRLNCGMNFGDIFFAKLRMFVESYVGHMRGRSEAKGLLLLLRELLALERRAISNDLVNGSKKCTDRWKRCEFFEPLFRR